MPTRRRQQVTATRARDSSDDRIPIRRRDRCGRLGHGAGGGGGARRAERDALGTKRRACDANCSDSRKSAIAAACGSRRRSSSRASWRWPRARDMLLIATPAQHLRGAVNMLASHHGKADAGRRLRQGHRARHSQIHDRRDRGSRTAAQPAILSGPSFADDVAQRPADGGNAGGEATRRWRARWYRRWARRHSGPITRTDVRGVEIGGAAKNVLAIAVGHRGRPQARRLRAGGAHHPRLCRARPASAARSARAARRSPACPASAI